MSWDNTDQVTPEIVKREMIAEYKRERDRVSQADYQQQSVMRDIQQAYRDLAHVEGTRENENGVLSPEYQRYNDLAKQLWDQKHLPCYKAAPMLWATYTQTHKANRALSIQEVIDALV